MEPSLDVTTVSVRRLAPRLVLLWKLTPGVSGAAACDPVERELYRHAPGLKPSVPDRSAPRSGIGVERAHAARVLSVDRALQLDEYPLDVRVGRGCLRLVFGARVRARTEKRKCNGRRERSEQHPESHSSIIGQVAPSLRLRLDIGSGTFRNAGPTMGTTQTTRTTGAVRAANASAERSPTSAQGTFPNGVAGERLRASPGCEDDESPPQGDDRVSNQASSPTFRSRRSDPTTSATSARANPERQPTTLTTMPGKGLPLLQLASAQSTPARPQPVRLLTRGPTVERWWAPKNRRPVGTRGASSAQGTFPNAGPGGESPSMLCVEKG